MPLPPAAASCSVAPSLSQRSPPANANISGQRNPSTFVGMPPPATPAAAASGGGGGMIAAAADAVHTERPKMVAEVAARGGGRGAEKTAVSAAAAAAANSNGASLEMFSLPLSLRLCSSCRTAAGRSFVLRSAVPVASSGRRPCLARGRRWLGRGLGRGGGSQHRHGGLRRDVVSGGRDRRSRRRCLRGTSETTFSCSAADVASAAFFGGGFIHVRWHCSCRITCIHGRMLSRCVFR
jgi:hypothetical protein